MTPKQQAKSVLDAMERNINETTMGGITQMAKECALTSVSALIAEHTWALPIEWNNQRKAYWISVKKEIEDFKIN